ncbi:MAG: hypothetical protein IIX39_04795 [Clostridia bacterium]|nr:hypothetical protein [Clostridia bacterium]
MRDYKRITLLCGHYGSGKTNIAVNMAFDLKNQKENVAIADLDIVNPYFRTKDSIEDFKEKNIRLICSEYANTNVDIPALPQDMYAITDDKNLNVIIDVGGDDRGALALGRLSEKIKKENDYEMLMVVNFYRPLTQDVDSMIEVMREIEIACNIKITGLINNSNLGESTTPEDILRTFEMAKELSKKTSLPIVMTSVEEKIYKSLEKETENLFSLRLQKKPI